MLLSRSAKPALDFFGISGQHSTKIPTFPWCFPRQLQAFRPLLCSWMPSNSCYPALATPHRRYRPTNSAGPTVTNHQRIKSPLGSYWTRVLP